MFSGNVDYPAVTITSPSTASAPVLPPRPRGDLLSDRDKVLAMFTNGSVGADYQPIVDLASDRICGWEALARYRPNPATYTALDLVEAARHHDLLDELTWRSSTTPTPP